MRLIDADALPKYTGYALSADEVAKAVENAPTIEAEPVRRGKWKYVGVNTYDLLHGGRAYEPTYLCSLCEMVSESYVRLDEPIMPRDADYPNYCPNCGARMEE